MISFFKRDNPITRERAAHCISRANIDPDALKVLYRLANTGHTAYLVGGSVRDLLLGRQPKDFDIGTDARPNDIRRLFETVFSLDDDSASLTLSSDGRSSRPARSASNPRPARMRTASTRPRTTPSERPKRMPSVAISPLTAYFMTSRHSR